MEKLFKNSFEKFVCETEDYLFEEASDEDTKKKKDVEDDEEEPEKDKKEKPPKDDEEEPEGSEVPDGEPDGVQTSMDDFLAQGKAIENGFEAEDADPEELKAGIRIEMEHTSDPEIAKKIAVDHLSELEDYYTRLAEMEASASTDENIEENLLDPEKIKILKKKMKLWMVKMDKKSLKAVQNFMMTVLGM